MYNIVIGGVRLSSLDISKRLPHERMYRLIAAILGIILTVSGIFTRQISPLFIGIIFLLYYGLKKENILYPDKLITNYNVFFLKRKDIYHILEKTQIDILKQKTHATVYFIKEGNIKKLQIDNEIVEPFVSFIMENTNFNIDIRE